MKEKLKPLFNALDTFLREPNITTTSGPHVRDSVDLKRIMMIVVFALIPCTIMAVWNSGLTSFVYGSGDAKIMQEYFAASSSFSNYLAFAFQKNHFFQILKEGLFAFIPILIISYTVGGFWEVLFSCIRGHEISEGFLVTGILFALILPPTIPYWMAAVGVSVGVILGKEFFGGTGMNILNPALTCRCFLYFTFPNKMTGNIWVGTNPTKIRESLHSMSMQIPNATEFDGFTQATPLNDISANDAVRRIHVDAIGAFLNKATSLKEVIMKYYTKFSTSMDWSFSIDQLTLEQLQKFVTSPLAEGGLGLSPEYFPDAFQLATVKFSHGINTDGNFFFGNMLGSFGETSTLACLIGAVLLIVTSVASWRTMFACVIGAFATASIFQFVATHIGIENGAWNIARYDLPAYKHLIIGSLAFGTVFMATDPVSSPTLKSSKWVYGILIGFLTIIIRLINPAFPEGVMLAILFANVFAPLLDIKFSKLYLRNRSVRKQKALQ